MTDDLLKAALVYAKWGWAIHPLRPGDKRPLLDDWPNRATCDPETIRGWWASWPAANIGLACGPSGLLAVDLDVKADADGLAAWEALGVRYDPTPTSNTPSGGRHILFYTNGADLSNTAGKLGAGIDTRAGAGYIVLPPSRLPDGRRWAWDTDAHPNTCKPAPLPEVVKLLLTSTAPSSRPTSRPSTAPAGGDAYALAALRDELGRLALANEGSRNETLNAAAFSLGQLVGGGLLDRAEVEARLLGQAHAIGLGDHEAQATIKSGLDAGEKKPRGVPDRQPAAWTPAALPPGQDGQRDDNEADGPPPGKAQGQPAAPDPYETSDLANSQRLAAWHGADLRWCNPWGSWLAWDGKRWQQDDTREVGRRANQTVRAMQEIALEENLKDFGKWAFGSLSGPRRREMVNGARDLLPILPGDLDGDPWALTCNNGTLDLKTGQLHPHERGQMITKLAPVDYDPAATCPTWEAFLDRVMAGDRELIAFLRRAVGYSLTGDTREQCLFICYGTGANGKSTFLEALTGLLDEYGLKTPIQTVLIKKNESIREDVARLKGARLVTAVEAEEGQRLAEALVKELTGGDTVAARHLYAKTFEFKPEFKLWLATNHKPQIRGTDNAIWRRIRLIPFTVTIPPEEQDKTLGAKLAAELPGILAWAVRGCLEWQAAGLGVPEVVKRATADYQTEMDILAGFIEDCCLVKLTARATVKNLYDEYKTWAEENSDKPISKRALGLRLQDRGFTPGRGAGGVRLWEGIGLLSDPEQLDLLDPTQGRETFDI